MANARLGRYTFKAEISDKSEIALIYALGDPELILDTFRVLAHLVQSILGQFIMECQD